MDQLEPQLEGAGSGGKLTQAMEFVTAARHEMEKVTWPSKDELIKSTQMVVVVAIVLGSLIGLLDVLLTGVLINFIGSLGQ